jgi:hypothetical protein
MVESARYKFARVIKTDFGQSEKFTDDFYNSFMH